MCYSCQMHDQSPHVNYFSLPTTHFSLPVNVTLHDGTAKGIFFFLSWDAILKVNFGSGFKGSSTRLSRSIGNRLLWEEASNGKCSTLKARFSAVSKSESMSRSFQKQWKHQWKMKLEEHCSSWKIIIWHETFLSVQCIAQNSTRSVCSCIPTSEFRLLFVVN